MSWLYNLKATPGEGSLRRHLIQALLLIAIPSVAAIAFNLVRPAGLPLIAQHDYTDDILVPCPENLVEAEPVHIDSLPVGSSGDVIYVDARTPGEFLSWHIVGAVSIPHRTLSSDAEALEADIERALEPLRAMGGVPIVVCGDSRVDSGRSLGSVLGEQGFSDVRYLVGGCDAWLQDGRPVERTSYGLQAVDVDDLELQLDGRIVVDARFSRYYRRGHLPGAVCVSYTMVSGPEDSRLDPLREHQDDRVLVYGSASREEGESLARLLAANGWTDVSYLQGGFEAWEQAGRPVESESPPAEPLSNGTGDGVSSGTGESAETGRPQ